MISYDSPKETQATDRTANRRRANALEGTSGQGHFDLVNGRSEA